MAGIETFPIRRGVAESIEWESNGSRVPQRIVHAGQDKGGYLLMEQLGSEKAPFDRLVCLELGASHWFRSVL